MRKRNFPLLFGVIPAAFMLLCAAAFFALDPETEALSDEERHGVDGSFLRLPEGVVHYALSGPAEAPTVVFVHGFSVPYYIWDPTVAALTQPGLESGSAAFRTLRYDLYGRGYSDRPDVIYDADLYDRQLLGLLEALNIQEPVDLVGLSMGGPIVVTFADRHPERTRKLVLIDSAYHGARQSPFWLSIPLLSDWYMAVAVVPSLAEGQLADFYDPSLFLDWPDKYRVQMRYKGFRRALLSTMRHYSSRDVRSEFARIGQSGRPVQLIWGSEDRTVPVEVSSEILKAIPQAKLHVINEAGHLPHYERPKTVNQILIEFLKQSQLEPRP
jgi:pimeloyl-ACP methyl ester carboxylesterase